MTEPIVQHEPCEVMRHWLAKVSPACIEPVSVTDSFSGAKLWRIAQSTGYLCLRRWPSSHPTSEGLQAIHGLISHVAKLGCEIVPIPLRAATGTTFMSSYQHFWELTPWLPGTAEISRNDSGPRLTAALEALADFHHKAQSYSACGNGAHVAPSPGLRQRLDILKHQQRDNLLHLERSVHTAKTHQLQAVALELLDGVRSSIDREVTALQQVVDRELPLQWCLRDVRRSHFLFDGDSVTGLLDFGAAGVDSVAGDVARLLGDVSDEPMVWQCGIEAYCARHPLSSAERQALACFDRGGLLCSAVNWLRWLFVDGRDIAGNEGVFDHLSLLGERLQRLTMTDDASTLD